MAPKDTFTITANPGTDIWRKPPTTDVFNARLSFNFTPYQQYDQGGLLLSFRRRSSSTTTTNSTSSTNPSRKMDQNRNRTLQRPPAPLHRCVRRLGGLERH
ncbi:hypothetical protein N0V88_006864 [Collariella sp. IMI 366227]|nr:hypothetical protein N0V88_006864 [Collariella sp. IMI 366227]